MIKEAELDPKADGQIPILAQDYLDGDSICKDEPVYVTARTWTWIRATSFLKGENVHTMYGHPIDGLVAHVDLTNRKVLKIVDTGHTHIPMESGDYLGPKVTGPMRTDMKPQHIKQPGGGGASFTAKGNILLCQNWEIRVGFNGRKGLTLHDISSSDRGRKRKILSLPLANALVLGCNCLGSIQYLDVTVVDGFCEPFVIKNATCIHEEDFGMLWKHTDVLASPPTGAVRRQHRFVVSFFVTVGNNRYGFCWYFYLNGRDELDCKAAGIFRAARQRALLQHQRREKCLAKFTEVSSSPDAHRRPIQLPENGAGIYIKKARNGSPERYVRLSSENFAATLLHRWSLLTQNDLARLGDFRFEAFLYVERAAAPGQFHRATTQRVENARVQWMAYEAANAVNFGTITAHHLNIVHARRPNNTAFEVPTENTTAQAIALDQQREDIRRAYVAAEAERQTGEVMIRLNGLWMPVEVGIISSRRAIGLPDHGIFTQGIPHQFNAEAPSKPTMPDTDHQYDESMEEV
ncbi:hypothetical protein PR003_g18628 [Phytophthora rubi]|uniref:Amine oxidase n=1 Tax=Phytophthora rubi TaxID=129364 RepID=A0A6A4DZ74_9STRA|nr:hypothetical protein PR003_g18628 [Phytophthora rubi]